MTEESIQSGNTTFCFPSEHEPAVHQAVCRMLSQAASGETMLDEPLSAVASNLQVEGAFVTLKRDRQLRSCYGCFGGPFQLSTALGQASQGAATKDPRFPIVRVDELPQMHVEVSLLHSIQPIAEKGQCRRESVTVGQHGLTIRSAGRAGLLLPRVATDFGLDAEGFLVQVCKKAGLPPQSWMEEDAEMQTFEVHCFGGVFVGH